MNKIGTTLLPVYSICVGVALLLSVLILRSNPRELFVIVTVLLGLALHKKLNVLLILTIMYVTVFHTLTTLLWDEFKVFELNAGEHNSIDFMIYNPFSTTIFVGFITYIIVNYKTLIIVLKSRSRGITQVRRILLEIIALIGVLISNYVYLLSRGGHPVFAGYFNCFLFPMTMFVAVVLGIIKTELREADFYKVVKAFLILAVLLGCFGIIEFWQKENVIFGWLGTKDSSEWHASFYSMTEASPYRIFTLMGHPLSSASLFLAALVYSLGSKRIWAFLIVLFFIANMLTFSRTAIVLAPSLLFLFFLLKKQKAIGMRVLVVLVGCLIMISAYLSPLRQGVEGRFGSADAEGSAQIRVRAFAYAKDSIVGSIPDMLFGKGAGRSREISEKYIGSKASFEIPWIMMAIDNGLIVTIIYIGILVQVLIILLPGVKTKDDISIISFLVILGESIQLSSYNAIVSALSHMGLFLWFLLALSIGYKLLRQERGIMKIENTSISDVLVCRDRKVDG